MKPWPKQRLPEEDPFPAASAGDSLIQIRVWLHGVSLMVRRRVVVPACCTLRELHGMFQVGMGWEGTHLFQSRLRAVRYGSWELSSPSQNGGKCPATIMMDSAAGFSRTSGVSRP